MFNSPLSSLFQQMQIKYTKPMKNRRQAKPTNTNPEDLQLSLIETPKQSSFEQFEKVFNQKKKLSTKISQQKKNNQQINNSLIMVKQRVNNINSLQRSIDKQAAFFKHQKEKIETVHTMEKIKILQKLVRLDRQTSCLQKNRQRIQSMKKQHERASSLSFQLMMSRRQQARHGSLSLLIQTQELRDDIFEENWIKAEKIRRQKQRRAEKASKIEQYKLQRAQRNYSDKLSKQMQIFDKSQDNLTELYRVENTIQQSLSSSKASSEYVDSFFPTFTTI